MSCRSRGKVDVLLYPVQVRVRPGVHAREVWAGARVAEGDDAHQRPALLLVQDHQGSSGVTLTGVDTSLLATRAQLLGCDASVNVLRVERIVDLLALAVGPDGKRHLS